MARKKILIICHSDHSREPRLIKQLRALKNDFEITTAGFKAPTIKGVKFIDLTRKRSTITFHLNFPKLIRKIFSSIVWLYLKTKQDKRFASKEIWDVYSNYEYNLLKEFHPDLIITHHLNSLPLAFQLKSERANIKLVVNAHEYYPKEFEGDLNWVNTIQPKYNALCKKYLPKADMFFNSCVSFANEYERNFGVKSVISNNAAAYFEQEPELIENGKIRLIHHGIAIEARKMEQIVDMLQYLDDRFSLDLMLIPDTTEYFTNLKKYIDKTPRAKLIDIVPIEKIAEKLNEYDMGICFLPNNGFNNENSLPNKFFDFVQGRIGILTAPSPEVKMMVEKYKLGVVADNFTSESLAMAIKDLTKEQIKAFKQQSHKYARELSSENTEQIILNSIKNLLGS